MARYKKIDVRIWGDEKFRELSAPPPSGQFLWFRLLFPRESTNIPGLFVASEATLAEHLSWSLKGFRKAWSEIESKNMAIADWKAHVIFIPKAINYHEPENPNVITSWRGPWDEVPECDLKRIAYEVLHTYIAEMEARPRKAEMKKGWLKAFLEGCRISSRKELEKGFRERYLKTGAGAVTGTVTGAGAFPFLPGFSQHENNIARTQGESGEKLVSKVSDEERARIWGPVEAHIRKQVSERTFKDCYQGTKILDLDFRTVILGVPKGAVERHGEHLNVAFATVLLACPTDLLRGRILKVIPLETQV